MKLTFSLIFISMVASSLGQIGVLHRIASGMNVTTDTGEGSPETQPGTENVDDSNDRNLIDLGNLDQTTMEQADVIVDDHLPGKPDTSFKPPLNLTDPDLDSPTQSSSLLHTITKANIFTTILIVCTPCTLTLILVFVCGVARFKHVRSRLAKTLITKSNLVVVQLGPVETLGGRKVVPLQDAHGSPFYTKPHGIEKAVVLDCTEEGRNTFKLRNGTNLSSFRPGGNGGLVEWYTKAGRDDKDRKTTRISNSSEDGWKLIIGTGDSSSDHKYALKLRDDNGFYTEENVILTSDWFEIEGRSDRALGPLVVIRDGKSFVKNQLQLIEVESPEDNSDDSEDESEVVMYYY